MKDIVERIEMLIQQDPGNRGLCNWARQGDLLPAIKSLQTGRHMVITTGFFILSAGVIETDGPPGAIILARALSKMGKPVSILVDEHSEAIMQKGLALFNCDIELITVPVDRVIAPHTVFTRETTHLIALERPGKAVDGKYYNFRGQDISAYVAPVDDLFDYAKAHQITTIGIGDGGNELGMGKVSDAVDKHVAPDRAFSCKTYADYCICAGVSNWAGYGMAAILSLLAKPACMPEPARLEKLIRENVEAGAVDGVSGKPEVTVDGLQYSWEHSIFCDVCKLATE